MNFTARVDSNQGFLAAFPYILFDRLVTLIEDRVERRLFALSSAEDDGSTRRTHRFRSRNGSTYPSTIIFSLSGLLSLRLSIFVSTLEESKSMLGPRRSLVNLDPLVLYAFEYSWRARCSFASYSIERETLVGPRFATRRLDPALKIGSRIVRAESGPEAP